MNFDKIIKDCKNQDKQSQDQLVRLLAPTLMGVCVRYCSDRTIAQDALQETFINIFKYIDKYSGNGSFEGWTRRIAVNCSYAILKKIRPVQFHEGIDTLVMIPTDVPDIYSKLGKEELLELIRQLPREQYLIFNMKVIEGYSHQEIAKVLNISESTSRSYLTRARHKLQKKMVTHEATYIGLTAKNAK